MRRGDAVVSVESARYGRGQVVGEDDGRLGEAVAKQAHKRVATVSQSKVHVVDRSMMID